MTKQEILNAATIAVYSDGLCGLELKGIEYDIEDHVYIVSHYGDAQVHRLKVYYSSETPYIRLYDRRYYMSDFIREEGS